MHLAHPSLRSLTARTLACAVIAFSSPALAADRTPLVGAGPPTSGVARVHGEIGLIVPISPDAVPCTQSVTFSELAGGPAPGTNYDGVVASGGMLFAERFAGQTSGSIGDFDLISGAPTNPLLPQVGAAGQNLDIFDYAGNVLTGLGAIGFPDIDAIGEGSIAMEFPVPQSRVKLDLVGGNGGAATLTFYRADGTFLDVVTVSGLADLSYGFATIDDSPAIAGILVQNTDASGIGVDNICYGNGPVGTRAVTWGNLKELYR